MNWVYIFMHGITEKVTFPIPIDMEGKGCALFDIRSKVKPLTNEPLFLCTDFVKLSMVGNNKQMPILRNINLLKDESMEGGIMDPMYNKILWLKDESMGGGIMDPMYNKILWLPTNHSPLKEI